MSRSHTYFIYILASKTRRLYVGMTNDLEIRVWQHKNNKVVGICCSLQHRPARLLRGFSGSAPGDRTREADQEVATREEDQADRGYESGLAGPEPRMVRRLDPQEVRGVIWLRFLHYASQGLRSGRNDSGEAWNTDLGRAKRRVHAAVRAKMHIPKIASGQEHRKMTFTVSRWRRRRARFSPAAGWSWRSRRRRRGPGRRCWPRVGTPLTQS